MNQSRNVLRWLATSAKSYGKLQVSRPLLTQGLRALTCASRRDGALINLSPVVTKRLMSSSSAAAEKFEVINVQSEDDFQKRVLEATKPVVVDFHATWCGPCKILGPRLESILAEGEGSVVMAKVDIDEQSELAMQFGVRSVPTVFAVKDGKITDHFIGLKDDDQIRGFVDKLVVS